MLKLRIRPLAGDLASCWRLLSLTHRHKAFTGSVSAAGGHGPEWGPSGLRRDPRPPQLPSSAVHDVRRREQETGWGCLRPQTQSRRRRHTAYVDAIVVKSQHLSALFWSLRVSGGFDQNSWTEDNKEAQLRSTTKSFLSHTQTDQTLSPAEVRHVFLSLSNRIPWVTDLPCLLFSQHLWNIIPRAKFEAVYSWEYSFIIFKEKGGCATEISTGNRGWNLEFSKPTRRLISTPWV